MNLNALEIGLLIVVWWACAIVHNGLDWHWQVKYDKMIQESFANAE